MWEKLLRLLKQQFVLVSQDSLIWAFAVWLGLFAHCTLHFDTEPVKLPEQLPGQGGSSKHLWQEISSWKPCNACHGEGRSVSWFSGPLGARRMDAFQ